MDKINIKYILSTVAVILFVAFVLFFYQSAPSSSPQINQGAVIPGQNNQDDNGSVINALPPDFDQAEETRKFLLATADRFSGKIASTSESGFAIVGQIVDLSKLKTVDYSKSAPLPSTEKNFQVTVNSSTRFVNGKRSDIKTGIMVTVSADRLIYEADKVTASQIFIHPPDNAQPAELLNP